jgi:hypothetical protein
MRVPVALAILTLSVPAIAASPTSVLQGPGASPANCPRTTSYLADQTGIYRGRPLKPRKLNELPPGTAYMAVYRHIGGCEVPLTMVDYRNPRRR